MASLPPLVTANDVIERLPSSFNADTTRIVALARDASAAVRRFTRQDFVVSQSIINIRPIGARLILPKRPVISVDKIELKLLNQSSYTTIPGWYWDGSDEVLLTDGGSIINLAEEVIFVMQWQTPVVRVTWTHGYAETPDDVVGVVCSMIARIVTAPGVGGVISESVGEYSYRLADATAQGAMSLTKAEEDVLKAYRPRKAATAELRGS